MSEVAVELEIELEGSRGAPWSRRRGRLRGGRTIRSVISRVLLAASLAASPTAAQEVEAALGADTARVGDVVPVAVRVMVGPDERVVWPDTLPLAGSSLENAARVREQVDTLDDGRLARTGIYAVTPWRTGELALPELEVRVVGSDEVGGTRRASLPGLQVTSVLPADTAGLEPRPPRGVLGANWDWRAIGLIALLAALIVAGLVWWWRRRRAGKAAAAPIEPMVPPRERALAVLQEARDAGLLERGEVKEFYTRVSNAVRDYVAALEPVWGEDLTTTELLSRFRTQVGITEASRLRDVLAPADQVKFARRVPDRATALSEWETARAWVVDFDWPPPVTTEEAA